VSGGPVVCLHGLGRSPSDWAAVLPALAAFGPVRCPSLPRDPAGALAAARAAVAASPEPVVLVGHSMGAVVALRVAAERPERVRAVVLGGCFFPPARNGRGLTASVTDYGRHRVAFVREARRGGVAAGAGDATSAGDAGGSAGPGGWGERRGTGGSLRSLVGFALQPGRFDGLARAVRAPVLVVHAADDHHVPVDFALAAAARHPAWAIRVLAGGGHHAHVMAPAAWADAVTPWLRRA
jgi:pimeloyl-ACP methyl ester carboxylesterase